MTYPDDQAARVLRQIALTAEMERGIERQRAIREDRARAARQGRG